MYGPGIESLKENTTRTGLRDKGGLPMASADYQKRQEGSHWIFDVRPASSPKSLWFTILGGVCILMGLSTGVFGWIILVPAGAFSIWLGQFRDGRPAGHRNPSRCMVSPTEIEASGRFPQGGHP